MFLSILIMFFVMSALYFVGKKIHCSMRMRSALKKLPQLPFKSYFLVGHFYLFGRDPHDMFHRMKNIFLRALELTTDGGKMFLLSNPVTSAVVLTHPDSAKIVLKSPKEITKGKIMTLLRDWLAEGLAFSTGAKWWSRRRLLTPVFHFNVMEKFLDVMNEQSVVFINKLNSMVDGNECIDIHSAVASLALDIISETAMGVKVNAQSSSKTIEYAQAIKR